MLHYVNLHFSPSHLKLTEQIFSFNLQKLSKLKGELDQIQRAENKLRIKLEDEKQKVCTKCIPKTETATESKESQTDTETALTPSVSAQLATGSSLVDQVDFYKMTEKYQLAKKMYMEYKQKHSALLTTHQKLQTCLADMEQKHQAITTEREELQSNLTAFTTKYNHAKQICTDRAKYIETLNKRLEQSKQSLIEQTDMISITESENGSNKSVKELQEKLKAIEREYTELQEKYEQLKQLCVYRQTIIESFNHVDVEKENKPQNPNTIN